MIITLGIYYLTPFIRWDRGPNAPDQAVLIDLNNAKAYWFWIEIWPQEVYILTGILILAAIGLFFVTSLFGRVWCGYFCPQTVWTDLFVWVERIVQGDRNARKKLHESRWTFDKIRKIVTTHFIWLVIAWCTAGSFVLYFNDAPTLVYSFFEMDVSPTVLAFIVGLTFSTYLMAGYAREQVCTYMCPYARFHLGIVDIRVDGRHLSGSSLARDLREKFGLEDVYVSHAESDQSLGRAETLSQLGRVASTALLDIVSPGDRLGVAWGETIMAVADAMPKAPVESVEVCQLIGSMISERVPASENCTIQIASKLGAQCFTLHAPAMISSVELAERLKAEPTIKSQLERLGALDMSVFSIGNVSPETHLVAAGMASNDELAEARKAGAVGVVCCRYVDDRGDEIALPPSDRVIAAGIADLRAAKKSLLIVCGADRRDAALAAIRGGLATHLCVDAALGAALFDVT